MFQAGSSLVEQQSTVLRNLTSTDPSYKLNAIYERYCIQMASFYSVLTMVTIVNILTILISETCRFYDLKLNSSDTSNYCCVLFGILLIWTSSLIIISSLMLVGVADSAAPTWKCPAAESGASESTTRSLVINVVWFFLVAFVIFISFSYSFSLYKELRKIETFDNRFAMRRFFVGINFLILINLFVLLILRFTLYTINASLMAFKSDLIERQIKIVKQTKKRLIILIMLIFIYCVTFVPNFVTTILKNTLYVTSSGSLKPFNIIFSILTLANPTLNSIVLLTLCLKSDDRYLNRQAAAAAARAARGGTTSSTSSNDGSCDDHHDGIPPKQTNSIEVVPLGEDGGRRGRVVNRSGVIGRRENGEEFRASIKKLVNRVLSKRGLTAETANAMIVSDRAMGEPTSSTTTSGRNVMNNLCHNIRVSKESGGGVPLSELEPCLKRDQANQEEEVSVKLRLKIEYI